MWFTCVWTKKLILRLLASWPVWRIDWCNSQIGKKGRGKKWQIEFWTFWVWSLLFFTSLPSSGLFFDFLRTASLRHTLSCGLGKRSLLCTIIEAVYFHKRKQNFGKSFLNIQSLPRYNWVDLIIIWNKELLGFFSTTQYAAYMYYKF